jgi:hypothetical protein
MLASFGTQSYAFTPPTTGTYTISITDTSANGDMGWALYDDGFNEIGFADSFDDNSDEISTVELIGGATYIIEVDEYAAPGSSVSYTLSISTGS